MAAKEQVNRADVLAKAKAKLAAAGFKAEKALGMNFLGIEEGDTKLVRITSGIETFTKKNGKTFDYVLVDDLETGESDLTLWLGGQLKYTLKQLKDGFAGGKFAITHLGHTEVEGDDGETYDAINYNVMPLSE